MKREHHMITVHVCGRLTVISTS